MVVHRVILTVFGALLATTAAAASETKSRNGKISFWSDLGPAAIFVINPDGKRSAAAHGCDGAGQGSCVVARRTPDRPIRKL